MLAPGSDNPFAVRKMKEVAVATAPHKLPPSHCGAFFRPPEAFSALKAWVVEELLERATSESGARVWVPACGAGEEAYSIALLLMEHFQAYGRQPNLQIFATDADSGAIRTARTGVYPESDLLGVSLSRMQRFFLRNGTNQLRVCPALRDRVVFATHDLEQDLPFRRLDLVSCYNALRLDSDALAQAFAKLHFALNDGGYLLLHPDGSAVPPPNLFQRVDPDGFVYARVADGSRRMTLELHDEELYRAAGAIPLSSEAASSREDLLTSRERLLSASENLLAINRQLAGKVERLAAAHHKLSETLAATDIAVLVLDRQLRIERFTSPAGHLLNLRDEDVGRPWSAVARGFDEQLAIDSQLATETRTTIEKTIRGYFDGWYLRRVQAFRSEVGADGGVVATYVDITLQVESDMQQRRFAAMLRDAADAIVVTDFDGNIVAWNRGAQRLYGYTQAEALKLNIRDLMTGDRLDPTLEVMRRVTRGEAVPPFDTQRRTRDGRMVDVSATVALLFDVAGNAESLAATERDITARRRAEDEARMLNVRLEQRVAERANQLQYSEDQIRAILDATADAVVTIDVLGRITTFNPAAERIFGYSASEAIGQNVTILIPPQERFGRYGYKATAVRSYASRLIGRSHEISGRRKDGSTFPIQLSVNSVEGRGLFVGVARDMTEHRALQKEIIDVAMLEQRRIGQELHDGTQQELTGLGLLALSLAESLNRSGSAAASHIAARVARGIEQCSQRVRALARGMVPVPVDRDGLMRALAELARQTTEIYGLPCSFDCPAPVEIDNDNEATHLYRIAQEALNNATRHAKASAIWIRLEQVDGRLVLEVQDNGIGIQANTRPGKGVGLRLMEHRCAMIGGTFALDPRADGGTCIACSVSRAEDA